MSWNDIPSWTSSVATSLMNALKAKDVHTYLHCLRVGKAARLLGQAAGLNEYEQYVLEYAGMFHDIGKLGIPDEVLFKPSRLTRDEYQMVKLHPLQSMEIIKPLLEAPFFKDLVPGVELHHERIDGLGYPYGLEAKDIPLSTRIVTIVDSVDAMYSARPYNPSRPMSKVIEELKRCSGTQFDADLVKVYIDAFRFWQKSATRKSPPETEDKLLIADSLLRAAS